MCLGDLGILSNNSKRSKAQPGIIGLRSTAQTFTGLDCCLSPSFLAAGEPGDLKVSSLCPVDASPGRALVPGSWKPALFFSKCLCLLCLLLLPPHTPKKGGCPCVEYTACNFAVKPQLGGQCCDWLCKDLSLKGNYTKFPLKDSSLWIEYKKTPTSHPCSWKCFRLCGCHWRSGDTLRHSDSSEERLQGDKTQGQGKHD